MLVSSRPLSEPLCCVHVFEASRKCPYILSRDTALPSQGTEGWRDLDTRHCENLNSVGRKSQETCLSFLQTNLPVCGRNYWVSSGWISTWWIGCWTDILRSSNTWKNGSAFGKYVWYSLTSGKPVIQLGVRFGVTYPLNSVDQNVWMKPVETPDLQSFDKSPVKCCVSCGGSR
jgi:hypothetical protein